MYNTVKFCNTQTATQLMQRSITPSSLINLHHSLYPFTASSMSKCRLLISLSPAPIQFCFYQILLCSYSSTGQFSQKKNLHVYLEKVFYTPGALPDTLPTALKHGLHQGKHLLASSFPNSPTLEGMAATPLTTVILCHTHYQLLLSMLYVSCF